VSIFAVILVLPAFADDFVARGTSEPGPFGVIVGDPLVKNVAAIMQGTRGYAVQVDESISLSRFDFDVS
jgi:hypothetical protein